MSITSKYKSCYISVYYNNLVCQISYNGEDCGSKVTVVSYDGLVYIEYLNNDWWHRLSLIELISYI
jgi:hypothetical protein